MTNTTISNTDPLYSTEEASSYLNRDPRTLANDRCNGEGPNYIKLGRLIRYSKSSLDKYILENTTVINK